MAEWQPIETAPKDPVKDWDRFGPVILLWGQGGWALAYWGCGIDLNSNYGWVNIHDHYIMRYQDRFTHWMPLPEPPDEKA